MNEWLNNSDPWNPEADCLPQVLTFCFLPGMCTCMCVGVQVPWQTGAVRGQHVGVGSLFPQWGIQY